MIPLVLFAIALLVRVAVGAAFAGPAYPDSYYYVNVAQQLAAGNGFSVDYIWNFVDVGGRLPDQAVLPIPSNGHWMPLVVLVQVPFIWLFGPGALAAGLPLWLAGAAAAPLTYLIGREAGFAAGPAVGAGLLAAAPGGLTPFFGQPDNFGLFMALGALSLWLCARGLRGDRRAFICGGLVVGLATLARSDGILLGIPFALVALLDLRPGRARQIGVVASVACAALFLVAVGPWLYRQLEVFGSIAPSASNGRILWISDYSQLYSIGTPATPETLLADGVLPLLASRVGGLVAAVSLFTLLPLMAVLTAPAALGAWLHRRDPHFRPFFIYALALFAASGLLFAVHVPHGTFIHSAVALLPHTYLLVMAGIAAAVAWMAARRSRWDAAQATRIFGYGAVGVAFIGAVLQTTITAAHWSAQQSVQAQLAQALAGAPINERVMSADAGAFRYLAGRPGVVTPNDDLATVERAARAYGIRWLVLERNAIVPALAPVLTGESRPAWLSAAVAVVPGGRPAVASAGTAGPAETPAGAVFAVCFAADDSRCSR